MNYNNVRSDLANESIDALIEGTHYQRNVVYEDEVKIETFEILKNHPHIHQKKGTYIELSFKDYLQSEQIIEALRRRLKLFIDQYPYPTILVVGLGNQYLTNDAIGPRVLRDLRVTHFLDDSIKLENHYYDIMALSPGVMYQTGMESVDIIQAIVEKHQVDLVLVIDALCASDYQKLGHVIQINNVGIHPGSGIGNHRKAITKDTLGCDVIALGVPTVIYASSLVKEVFHLMKSYFGDSLNPINKLKVGKRKDYQGTLSYEQTQSLLGNIGLLPDEELHELLNEILNPVDRNYVLSDKQIDEQCEILSKMITKSINGLMY